jgi:hypothetical protein
MMQSIHFIYLWTLFLFTFFPLLHPAPSYILLEVLIQINHLKILSVLLCF